MRRSGLRTAVVKSLRDGMRATLLPLTLSFLAGACVTLEQPAAAGPAEPSAGEADALLLAVARAVLEHSNAARRDVNAPVLVEVPALMRAAQGHAEELAVRGVLDHYSRTPGRGTPAERIDAAGGSWTRVGENLASTTDRLPNVPAQTIALWLNSHGHRVNLLDPGFTQSGVGVARDARHTYVVQLYVMVRPGQ